MTSKSQSFARKFTGIGSLITIFNTSQRPNQFTNYFKEFDFQYSDIRDEEIRLLIDILVDARDVYSQRKIDAGETREKFLLTLKRNVELKKQRLSKVPLHLNEKQEKNRHN